MAGQISSSFDIIYEDSSGAPGTTTIINPGRSMRVESCLMFAAPTAVITLQKNDAAGATIALSNAAVGGFDEAFPVAPYSGGVAADAILSATDNIFVTSTTAQLVRLVIRCVAADGQSLVAPDMT